MFHRRWAMFVLMGAVLSAGSVSAGQIVVANYDFTGGFALNPGPFSPSSITPTPYLAITDPTISATSVPAAGLLTGVTQNPLGGLGVRTDPEGPLSSALIDSVGNAFNGTPEQLVLTLNNTDPNVINTKATSFTVAFPLDVSGSVDFNVLGPDGVTSVGMFSFAGGFSFAGTQSFTFTTPVSLLDGQSLTFLPLTPVGFGVNAFSVVNLQVQAEVIPEPTSLAVFGLVGIAGAYCARRRRKLA